MAGVTGLCATCHQTFLLRPGQARCSPKRKLYCKPRCRQIMEKRRIQENYPHRGRSKPHAQAAVLYPLTSSTDQGLFGGSLSVLQGPCTCAGCEAYTYDPARQCQCGAGREECTACETYRRGRVLKEAM